MWLTEKDMVESRSKAQALIMAGKVLVNGAVVTKAGTAVPADAVLEVAQDLPYVSRGGLKLAAALDAFAINPTGAVCADVGASTGGFTDVLLQRGAAKIYALDVGYGQLAWKLRQDERVIVMERTNARHVESLPEPVNLVTVDASFISIKLLLPAIVNWLAVKAVVIILVKPQFEAGKAQVGKGGVVRDPAVHRQVLANAIAYTTEAGLHLLGLIPSPITGPAGNHEFLLAAGWPYVDLPLPAEEAIERCLARLQAG